MLPCLCEHLALGFWCQRWALSASEICNLSCPFWAVGGWLGQSPPDLRLAGKVGHCQHHPVTALNPLRAAEEIRSLISYSLSPLVLKRLPAAAI